MAVVPRVGDCRDFLLLELVGNAVARHLVGRIPARTDRDIQRPGIEHRMRVVPADDRSQLDRGARPIGLVARGIGTVAKARSCKSIRPATTSSASTALRSGLFCMSPRKTR